MKRISFSKKILAIAAQGALMLILLAPAIVFAQDSGTQTGSFVPLTQLPGISDAANAATLPAFFNQLYKIAIGAGAVLAVLSIMYGGVLIMTSRGSVSSNEKAKSRIQNAILGLVLVLSPTIVFGIINPSILSLDFTKDVQNLRLKALDKIDTSSPTAGDVGPVGLAAKQCSTIVKKQVIQIEFGQNANQFCAAIGKAWIPYNNSCCSITDTTHACCGYDPKNDQTPAKPIADPVNDTGHFTIESYEQDTNNNTGEKCVQQYTNHYTSTASCNAAAAAFAKKTTLHASSNNCATDDSKLTSKTLAPILPASAYAELSKLPPC